MENTSKISSKRMPQAIGKALLNSYIIYRCSKIWPSGYRLMSEGRDILLATWSPGSFYPAISALVEEGMLIRRKSPSKRLTYEYHTTPKGIEYLKYISKYFSHQEVRVFLTALLEGSF